MKRILLIVGVLFSSFSLISQEIDVTGKNISIPSGNTAITKKNDTGFGEAVSASPNETISKTFTITNTGSSDLTITGSVTVTSDFSITSQPSSPIAPNSSSSFTVQFDPGSNGTLTGTVTIPNDDADEGTYTFDVSGLGIASRSARYVDNNGGASDPGTVSLGGLSYNTTGGLYTDIATAIAAAGTYDIVYVADGTYTNANDNAGNTSCSIAGLTQELTLYIEVNKSNIIITSATGDYRTSAANLVGYGFNIRASNGSNVTIQGFDMTNIRVNAFWNSNDNSSTFYGPTSDVRILNNSVNGTHGHGIKTDSWASGGGPVIDRGAWEIVGNNFQNIGTYASPAGCGTTAFVSALWLAEAGQSFYIADNNIDGVNWAGILCDGYNYSANKTQGAVTIHNNTINNTADAGIQVGYSSSGNFYIPENAFITNNTITNANTSNKVGIGAITILQSNVKGVRILNNDISSSFNGLAIEIAGWEDSPDITYVNYNDFYSLSGGHAITHIAGISPNGLFNVSDDLAKYNFEFNYFGASNGPTYATNPNGTGETLLKDATLIASGGEAGTPYSKNDFDFKPFNTSQGVTNSLPVLAIDNANLAYSSLDAVTQVDDAATISDADGDTDWNGGTLVVQITANNEADDELSIPDNIVGTINTNTTNLRNNTTVIGTLSASEGTVTNGTALTITFNSAATNALVQQTLRAIHYRNISATPGTSNRTVTFTANDKGFAQAIDTRTIEVSISNTAPVFSGLNGTPTFIEGGSAIVLDADVTIADTELDAADYNGATLTIERTSTASSEDVFSNSGSLSALTESGNFNLGGSALGTVTTNSSGTLVLTFNATITANQVDQVLQSIAYSNNSDTPTASVTLDWIFNDGTFSSTGTNQVVVGITATNDIPVFTGLDGTPSFTEGGSVVVLDANVTVADPELDLADNYAGSILTIARNGGASAEDDFGFTAANSLALNGTNLELSNSVIGTFIESAGTLTLTFTGTGTAPDAATIDLVLQQINYQNTSDTPPATVTLDWIFNDGTDPSTGTNQTVVSITAVNDIPVFTGLDGTPAFTEDAAAVVLDADVTISDPELDASNYNGSTITIERTSAPSTEDVFSNSGSLTALTESGAFNLGGSALGTVTTNSSGTLVLTFNATITANEVDQVLQSIAYSNSSDTPPASVTLDWTFNDGTDPSTGSNQTVVSITAANDIPTLTSFGAAVDAVNDNVEVEITFAELLAQADEAEVEGTVDAFKVVAISSGTLEIGATNGTAFATTTNEIIDASNNAYWTSVVNANGTTTAAFTVVAVDNDGAESSTPIAVPVNVTDVTVPSLTTVTIVSNNALNNKLAKVGDLITMTIVSDEAIQTPVVTIAGNAATEAGSGSNYTATYTMQSGDTEGVIAFNIAFSDVVGNMGTAVTAVTSGGGVTFDKTAPVLNTITFDDTDDDGFIDQLVLDFSENVAAVDGTPSLNELGTFILTDGSTLTTAISSTDPAGATDIVTITNIAVLDYLTEIQLTSKGSMAITGIENLWVDNAGNQTNAASDASVTFVDVAKPLLISSSPSDESGSFPPASNFVFNFSENIQLGASGTRTIILNNVTGASTVETFDLTTAPSGSITIGTNSITINPASDLTIGNEYAIRITADAVDDLAGVPNSYAGIANDTDLNFTANNVQPTEGCFDYGTNYNINGGSNNGHLAASVCNANPNTMSSLSTTAQLAVSVFHYHLMNGNNTAEDVTQVIFRRGTGDNLNWTEVIDGAVLIDDLGNTQSGTINSNNITFSSIPAGNGELGDLPKDGDDANGKEYALRLWLKADMGSNALNIDGKSIIITLSDDDMSNVDRVRLTTGNYVNSSTPISTSFTISVVRTNYAFLTQPTDTDQNSVMSPAVTLEAVDVNGNRDLDYAVADAVEITSSGTLSGSYATPTVSGSWVAGVGTVSDIVHSAGGVGLTLGTTSGALTNAPASGAFTITADNTPPSVSTVTTNLTLIADANVGTGTFEVEVRYLESLDAATAPNITFSPVTTGSLDFNSGSFSTTNETNDTYTATYNVLDNDAAIADIDITINGAADAAGPNTQTVAFVETDAFSIDTENPTIAINTPIEVDELVNAVEDVDVVVSGTTSGAEDNQIVTVTFDDGTNTPIQVTATVTSNAWTASAADITGLDEGTITVTADVDDLAGNSAIQASETITLDQTAPSIAITTAIEGDNVVNAVEDVDVVVSGTTSGAEDNQIVTVTFDDGTNTPIQVTATVTSNAWTASAADITGLDEGTITVRADVDDLAGNSATQTSETITLDQSASIVITTPIEVDNLVNVAEDVDVVVSGTTSGVEDNQIVTVTFDDGTNTAIQVTATVTSDAWTASAADITGLDEGTITVTADVDDVAGNSAAQASENITLDQTAPTIAITSNAIISDGYLNAVEDNSDLVIVGTTVGAEDGEVVTLTLNGSTYLSSGTGGSNVSTNSWQVTIPAASLQALTNGNTYAISADVNDLADNPALQTTTGNFTYDITAPTIAITSNATISDGYLNAVEDNSDLVIVGTTVGAEDGEVVTLTLNGSTYLSSGTGGSNVSTNAWQVTIPAASLQALTDGNTYAISADVNDQADNPAIQVATGDFVYDLTSTISITSNATISDGYLNALEDNSDLVIVGTTTGVEDGQVVTLTLDGSTYLSSSTGGSNVSTNAWQVTIPLASLQALTDGNIYSIDADVTDLAGNVAITANSGNFTYDITAPTIAITSNATISDGYLNAVEDNNDLVIVGTTAGAEDGEVVTLTLNGSTYFSSGTGGSNVSTNAWQVTIPAASLQALTNGNTYAISADVNDQADNPAIQVTTGDFVYDLTSTISITSNATISDGYLNALEDNSDLVIVGTTTGVEDGQVVTLTLDGSTYLSSSTGGSNVSTNAWQVTIPLASLQALTDGNIYSIDADVTDLAGNVAITANSGNFTYDITAPTIAITSNATISDGYLNAVEDNSDLVIVGTTVGAEDGEVVTLTLNGSTYLSSGTGGSNVSTNAWQVTIPAASLQALTNGNTYAISADVNDLADNPALQTTTGNFTYDITAPTIAITSNATISDGYLNAVEDNSDLVIVGTTVGAEDGEVVTLTLNGSTYLSSGTGGSNVSTNAWQVTIPAASLQALTDGNTYAISADVNDQADNPAIQVATGDFVYDKTMPTVSNVTSSTSNGIFKLNDPISIQVVFDEPVDLVSGTPQLTLATGATTVSAVVDYVGGDGTNTFNFNYTVRLNDDNPDLDYVATNSLTGTITDLAGNAAVLTLPTPAAAGSLGANKNLNVDGLIPVVSASDITFTSSPTGNASTYNVGDVVTVQWDNTVATGDGNLDIDNGVTMDFTQFGGGASVSAVETALNSEIWEASITITSGTVDVINAHVFVTATDDAGNTNSGGKTEDEQDVKVDNYVPVVAEGEISYVVDATFGPTGANSTYQVGDQIKVQWNNSALSAPNQDISSVSMDFSEFGATVDVIATVASNVYTAVYTITTSTDGSTSPVDVTNAHVFVTAKDNADNTNAPTEKTTDVSVDNIFPALTVGNLNLSDGGGANGVNEYIIGDVVTATWSNLNGGDNIPDVASVSFNFDQFGGGIIAGATSDGGDTYTATYTIVNGGDGGAKQRNYLLIQDIILTVVDNASNSTTLEDNEDNDVDNVAPATPTVPDLIAASDNGIDASTGAALNTDNKTSITTPSFSGSGAEANQLVEIYSNTSDGMIGSANADGGGLWTVPTTITQLDQIHNMTAVAYDLSGNASTVTAALSSPNPFEHISAPAFVSAEWRDGNADGDIDQLFVTFNKSVVVTDNSATGFESITITDITFDNATDLDLAANTAQTFVLTPVTGTGNPNQSINYTTSSGSWIVSTNGGIEMLDAAIVLPVDKAAPVVINSITLDTNLDGDVDRVEFQLSEPLTDTHITGTGGHQGDFALTPAIGYGSVQVMSTFDTEVTSIAAVNTVNDAYFALGFTPASARGTGIFTAQYSGTTVVDGNSNILSIPASTILEDGAAPRVKIATGLSPADNSGAVPATSSLTITYTEEVTGVGGKKVNILQQAPVVLTTLDATSLGSSGVSTTTGSYTLDLGYTTPSATDYYVTIDAGAFQDAANNVSADQFNTTTDWNFTTETSLVVTAAAFTNSTTVTLTTNLAVALGTSTPANFTVLDGISNPFVVSAIGVSGTNITLTVADLTTAIGDLSVSFDGVGPGGSGDTDINANGNALKLQDFSGVAVNKDVTNPALASAIYDANSITLTYNDAVQNLGALAGDFSVRDGALNTYTVLSITDGSANDANLTLNFTGGSLIPLGDLSITYTKNGGNSGIADFGGNTAQTGSINIEIDGVSPLISAATIRSNTKIWLQFNEPIKITSAAPASDFNVVDGKGNSYIVSSIADSLAKDAYINLTLQNISAARGDLTVTYAPGGGTSIQDFGSNTLAGFSTIIDRDQTQPTLTVTRNSVTNGGNYITNDNTVSYTLVFSEEIDPSTFSATDDITVTGTGVTFSSLVDGDLTTANNTTYTLTVRDVAVDGNISMDVDLSNITDYGSNLVSSATYDGAGSDVGFTIDNTPPAITVLSIKSNNAASSLRAVAGDTIRIYFAVNDALLNPATVQIRSNGGLVNNPVRVLDTTVVALATTYAADYVVSNLDNSGNVTFTITFKDDGGNNVSSTVTQAQITDGTSMIVDSQNPTLNSITLDPITNGSASATNDDNVSFKITFSEPVVNFQVSDDITYDTLGLTVQGGVSLTSSDQIIWTLTFTNVLGDGNLSFNVNNTSAGAGVITDQAGNVLPAGKASPVVLFDNTPPTVTITNNALSTGSLAGTTDNSISYTIAFSTPILPSSFILGDVVITKPGVTHNTATITPLGDNQNYTFSITNIAGDGTLGISIAAGAVVDAANNPLAATSAAPTITIDNTTPTVVTNTIGTITNGTSSGTNDDQITFNIGFSEVLAVGSFTNADVTVISSGPTTGNPLVTSSDNQNFVVTLGSVTGDGNLNVRLFASSVEDPSGNLLATTINTPVVRIDNTLPTVTFSNVLSTITNSDPFDITATFSESVTAPLTSSFNITNGAVTGVATVSTTVYTITINPTNDRTNPLVLSLKAGEVTDTGGNLNALSSDYSKSFDDQAPVVTGFTKAVAGRTVTLGVRLNEIGTVYYAVVANGQAPPTSAQLKAGSVSPSVAMGTIDVTAIGTNFNEELILDADQTSYDLYYATEDLIDLKNLQVSPSFVDNLISGGMVTTAPNLVDICLEGQYFTLGDIVIAETDSADFVRSSSSKTLLLELPANFEFNDAVGSASGNGGDLSVNSLTYNTSKTSVTINFSNSTNTKLDVLTITGLQVRALGSSISTNVQLIRGGGSADMYLANETDNRVFATLTTIPPFDAPDIVSAVTGSETNPYIFETASGTVGDNLGDAVTVYNLDDFDGAVSPMTIGALSAGNVVRIFTDAGLSSEILNYNATANYSPTLNDLGLTTANVGITSFWITVTDGNACQSAATKYSVAIIRLENSALTTTFTTNDQVGATFKLSYPANHTALFNGKGLTNFEANDSFTNAPNDDAYSVQFIPAAAGSGRDTIKYALTRDGATANFWIPLLINSTVDVFADATPLADNGLCQEDGQVSFDVVQALNVDFEGGSDGADPDFFTIRVFNYPNETRGASLTSTLLINSPVPASANVPNSRTGWTLDATATTSLFDTTTAYSIDILVVMVIKDEGGTETELSSEVLTIYRTPDVSITNINDYYCEDDGDLNIAVQIISNDGTITRNADDMGYQLYKYNGSTYDSIATFTTALLRFTDLDQDGIDYLSEDETGMYRVIYTSSDAYTSATCSSSDTVYFELLGKPEKPLLINDLTNVGGLIELNNDGITDDYLLEYCQGDVIPTITASTADADTIIWYSDRNGTATLASQGTIGSEITPVTLFGTATPNAANLTIYFARKTSVDINDSGFDGCESELRTVQILVRANPAVPSVNQALITSGLTNEANLGLFNLTTTGVATTGYIYEYCGEKETNVTLLDIVIDNELATTEPSESYYTIYDTDGSTALTTIMGNVLAGTGSSTIEEILGYSAIATTSTGSSKDFFISRTDFDNIPAVGSTLNKGSEFNGCESDLRKFTISVFPIPEIPLDQDFKGGENVSNRQYSVDSNEMQYYMCSGDDLAFSQIEAPGLTGSAYTWYKDDGTGTAPSIAADAKLNPEAFNGRLITLQELEDAEVFTPDVTTTTTFVYWVTQTRNVNVASGFLGCESDPIKVNLTVFPDPAALAFDPTSSTSQSIINNQSLISSYCVGDLEDVTFEITGNPNSTFRYYQTTASANTLESASTTLFGGEKDPDGKIAPSPGSLLVPNVQGTYYFLLSQTSNISPNTNISDPNLTDFGGCESEISDMAFLTVNVYDIPSRPYILGDSASNTVYYCEDDVTANGLSVAAEFDASNLTQSVKWYEDNDNNGIADGAFVYEGLTPTAEDLGLNGTPGNGTYNFLITQTQDIAAGNVGSFVGCESSALRIVILEMPPMPVVADPTPRCNDDVTATNLSIEYNGVRPEIGTTRFNWYDSETGNNTVALPTTPNSPEVTNRFTTDWTQVDLSKGLDTTIYVSQEVSIGGITCEGMRSPVRVVIHPYPVLQLNEENDELTVKRACDAQSVVLEITLDNLNVNDAKFKLFGARSNPYPDFEVATARQTIINDSTVRFEFEPESENLEAARANNQIESGNNTFVVEVIDNSDPTDGQSCVTLASRTLEIGTNPIPRVRWEGLTAGKTTDFIFRDDNTSTSVNYQVDSVYLIIDKLEYNQTLGKPLRKTGALRQDTISMIFNSPGTYLVEAYFVSSSQCTASQTRYITILETVDVVDNSTVIHTFENGSNGWVVDSTAVNGWGDQPAIWQLGIETTANYGTTTGVMNATNRWATLLDGDSYKANNNLLESQYIYSPAFNTTYLELPTISFLHARQLNAKDGVVLQQSVDDGRTWTLVGNYSDETGPSGKNWYNRRDLASSPGNSNIADAITGGINPNPGSNGWTDVSEGWLTSAHKVDRHESVRFRFAIGSLVGDNTDLDGFGFDDFKLYSREKKIIVEQFSSFNSDLAEAANGVINDRLSDVLSDDAIWINYYTDLVGADPNLNDRNNSDPGARLSYYGVSDVGTSILSGAEAYQLNGSNPGWSVDQFNSISLDTAGFKITSLTIGGERTELEITASFQSNIDLPAKSEVSFRFAVVEREKVIDGKIYYNVLRKMLPSSAGYTFVSDGSAKRGRTTFFGPNADQSSITINWDLPIDLVSDQEPFADQLRVIAFVQIDNWEDPRSNGLILQADFVDVVPGSKEPNRVVGIVKNKILDNKDFEIYPNPANKMFQLQLAEPAASDMNWVIYDQTGKEVKSGSLHAREMEIEINTIDLSSGVYLIQVFNEEESWKPKRLMIRR